MKLEWTADKCEYPASVVDLARRRSRFILGPIISLDVGLETALACAYLQGINDAIDAMSKGKK